MRVVDGVVLAGWAGFWIYWLAASAHVKAGQSRSTRFAGLRLVVIVATFVLVRAVHFRGHATTQNPWLEGIGLALFVSGLSLAIWARRYLGRNWGMPMSQKVDPELVTSGPYRRIRHPIYSGILLGMIGTTVAVSIFALLPVAVFGAYFLYSAFTEERFMESRFPDTYPAYKRSTNMLIPFIF